MAPSTSALSAVLLLTGSVCLFAIVFVTSLFVTVGEFKQKFHEDAREYEVISNGVWKDIADSIVLSTRSKRTPYDFEGSIYQRKPSCNCAQGPNTCPRGPAGPPGKPGYRGHSGRSGKPGYPGIPAVTFSGHGTFDFYYDKPCKKVQCPPGEPGPIGPDGPDGDVGADGYAGINGLPGRDGLTGVDGATGEIGKRGQTGINGPRGLNGHKGFRYTSLPGAPGRVGVRGPQGKAGHRGFPGEDGKQGAVGTIGVPGRWGDYGEHGKPGEMGERGAQGDDAEYCKCPPRTQEWEEITKGGETTTTTPDQYEHPSGQSASAGYENHPEHPDNSAYPSDQHPTGGSEQPHAYENPSEHTAPSSAGYENPTVPPSKHGYEYPSEQHSSGGYEKPAETPSKPGNEQHTTLQSPTSYETPANNGYDKPTDHPSTSGSTRRVTPTDTPSTTAYEAHPSTVGYENPTAHPSTPGYEQPTVHPSTVGYDTQPESTTWYPDTTGAPPTSSYEKSTEHPQSIGYDNKSENTSDKGSASYEHHSNERHETSAPRSSSSESSEETRGYPEHTEAPKQQGGYDQPPSDTHEHAPPTVDGGDNERAQPTAYETPNLQRSYGSTGQDSTVTPPTSPSTVANRVVSTTALPPGQAPPDEHSAQNGYDHPAPSSTNTPSGNSGYGREPEPLAPVRVIPTIRYNGANPATAYNTKPAGNNQPRPTAYRQPVNHQGYEQPARGYGAARTVPNNDYNHAVKQIQPLPSVRAPPPSNKNDIYKISHNKYPSPQPNLVFKAPDPAPLPLVNEVRPQVPYLHGN